MRSLQYNVLTLNSKLKNLVVQIRQIGNKFATIVNLTHSRPLPHLLLVANLGAVYMEAGLARLARQPGKRDLAT